MANMILPDDFSKLRADTAAAIARLEERATAAERALVVSVEELRAYKSSQNEWRGTISDLTSKFITRIEANALEDKFNFRINSLEGIAREHVGEKGANHRIWAVAVVLVGWVFATVWLIIHFAR